MESHLWIFINAIFLVLLSSVTAWWYKFYSLPEGIAIFRSLPSFMHVLMIFISFMALQIIIVPSIAFAGIFILNGFKMPHPLTENQYAWMNIANMYISTPVVWWIAYKLDPIFMRSITGSERLKHKFARNFNDIGLGAVTWLIAFPVSMVIQLIMQTIVEQVFNPPPVDQLPVKVFKNSFGNPIIYGLTFVGLAIVVPMVEELLFRGYFQQWLKKKVSLTWAIVGTSLLFAIFHFSVSHGWHNLVLIPALFLLSCFLGFLVERQHSLWASIGLHATFNFVSVIMITLEPGS